MNYIDRVKIERVRHEYFIDRVIIDRVIDRVRHEY